MNLPRVLNSSLQETRRLHPVSLSITDNITPLSNATMTIKKSEVVEGRTFIRLYTPNGVSEIYRTRVPEIAPGEDVATIQLEHAVCEIGDFVVQDAINEDSTVRNAFVKLFSHYRGSHWQLGSFSADEDVVIDCDYDNVLEMMLAILEQAPQYMMTFDFSTTPWTLSVAEKSNNVTAEGRLSRNIIHAQISKDDKDLCTRVYVRGLPKPEGRESDEDAVGYMDADTIGTYGVVEKETGGSNLTLEQAQRVAAAYLEAHKHPKISVEIDGADLSEITGETIDRFVVGKLFRLTVPDEDIIVEDYITQISWSDPYNDPYHAHITIGDVQDAAIEFLREQASSTKSARKGSKKQAKVDDAFEKNFQKTDEYGAILEQAGMRLDSHGMIVYARDNINNLGSIIEMTASVLRSEYQDGDAGVRSVIEQTACGIWLEVSDTKGEVESLISQTPDMITLEVSKAVSGFAQSVLTVADDYIKTEVSKAASTISSTAITQTAEYIETTVSSTASEVAWSVVTQTMGDITSEIGRKAQIFVQPTDPALSETVYEKDLWIKTTGVTNWNQLGQENWGTRSAYQWRQYYGGTMYVRKNNAWQEVIDSSTMVEQSTKIEQDDEHIALLAQKTDAQGEDYKARIQVTAQEIRSDVSASKSTLYSVISQTATNVFSGVYDTVADNFSTIEQTSTAITLAVTSAKSALESTIRITSTYIFSAVYDHVSSNFSTITQTSTSIALAVASGKSAVYNSVITATSTQLSLKVSKGSVISAINQSAEEITIQAGKINLSGVVWANYITADLVKTKIGDITSNLTVGGNVYAGLSGDKYFQGTALKLVGSSSSQGANVLTINYSNMSTAIKSASVSDNVLTLTPFVGSAITFSKAVTDWRYSWSGGQLTVTALPQENSKPILGVTTSGRWDGNTYKGRVVYWDGTDDETIYDVPNETFNISRAINSMGYTWTNGQLAVYPSPQGGNFQVTGIKLVGSWTNDYTFTVRARYWDGTDDDGATYDAQATPVTISDSNLTPSNIKNGVSIFGVEGTYTGGGGTHSISITPDNVGHSEEPSGTELWSSTTLLKNKWYKFTVNCGTASKVYKIYID